MDVDGETNNENPELAPHNRRASAKALREKWLHHIENSLYRPVLLIDEAQEMTPSALSELRLLSSVELDSRSILTTVLAGDLRLAHRLEEAHLLPIASRIRARLRTEALTPSQLLQCLNHLLKMAGNPKLMNPPLLQTLCEHAAGNLRLLMNMANDLLAAALHQEREQIDEKLFFEVFSLNPKPPKRSWAIAPTRSAGRFWTALLLYVLMRFLCVISRWNHSFTRLFTLLRAALWRKIDLWDLLKFCGTAGGHFRYLATPQDAYFPGFA